MQISEAGLLFVACREAIVLVAYVDGKNKDGSPKYSIGIGHNSPAIRAGDRVTIKDSFRLLREDMAEREKRMNKELRAPVSQAAWDALMSLNFNTGNRFVWLVVEKINAGKMAEAADLFPTFDHSEDGTKMAGLLKRRVMEQALFLGGEYGDLSQIKLFSDNPRASKPTLYVPQPGDVE